ncbi:MAG TPA: NAD(P)-dependent oxidoreductase, partial [Chloroflexota bacterium]|nr:NAD(P)-dependent oxidoreductase [Chloroflexota bacterium]
MRVLVTGSNSKLGAAIVAALSANHEVRTLDLNAPATGPAPTFVGDPRDRDLAVQATSDCDAVVHLGPLIDPSAPPHEVVDAATRGTYNLITTANAASRFILISTLRLFESYPQEWRVTEQWAPRPTTEIADLAPYLAECTVREVSRVMQLKGIALRLGEVVDDAAIAGQTPDPRWLHLDDAIQAVERALAFEERSNRTWEPPIKFPTNGWSVFHIVGGGKGTRFPLGQAGQEAFGYQPKHDLTSEAAPVPPRQREVQRLTGKLGATGRRVV